MTDPNSERLGKLIRQHVRVEVQLGVHFAIEGDPSCTIYKALTKNISRGGACIVVQEGKSQLSAAAAGEMPRLKVSLFVDGSDTPIDIQTQTAWISSKVGWFMTPARTNLPVLVGLAFEELPAEDAEKIDLLIEERLINGRESVQEMELRLLPKLDP